MPRVSVLLTNYNHGRFLAERIDSILQQDYRDFELLYLDDGSTDHSQKIIDSFDDPRIRQYPNRRNSGSPFINLNRGMGLACGEYIWVAEADDAAEPTLLSTLIEPLERNRHMGLAYCQSLQIDEHSQVVGHTLDGTRHLDPLRWHNDFQADGREECRHYLAYRNTIPNFSATLIRRSSYQRAGGAETRVALSGDYLGWIRLLSLSDLYYSARPLNRFRQHPRSQRSHYNDQGMVHRNRYLAVELIQQRVGLSPAQLEHVLDHHLCRWARKAIKRQLSLEAIVHLYQLTCRIDPNPRRRLLRMLASGLTAPSRDVRCATDRVD